MAYGNDPDPFAPSASTPSVSWKDAEKGHTVSGIVLEAPALVQERDFASQEPAHWEDGSPKMAAVVKLNIDGTERSLWAPKPSAIHNAIVKALDGEAMKVGGKLSVTFTDWAEGKRGKRRDFTATWTPPKTDYSGDPPF